jgi:recombinational DNA repair protein RecR
MAALSPELQDKLNELERELQVCHACLHFALLPRCKLSVLPAR